MPADDQRYFNPKRINALMALAAMSLLGALIWAVVHDHSRQWRRLQRAARAWDAAMLAGEQAQQSSAARFSNALRSAPLLQFINPLDRIRQVVVDDVMRGAAGAYAAAIDRCETCHVNISRPEYSRGRVIAFLEETAAHAAPGGRDNAGEEKRRAALLEEVNRRRLAEGLRALDPSPALLAHPRLDLYVAEDSPHPASRMGCTVCHDGAGEETDYALAGHRPRDGLEHPMLQRRHIESACARCHEGIYDIRSEAPTLAEGRTLFTGLGCANCHHIESIAGQPRRGGPDLRRVSEKLAAGAVRDWVWNPRALRPDARMPRFFMLANNSEQADILAARRDVDLIARWLAGPGVDPPAPAPPGAAPDVQSAQRGRTLLMGIDTDGRAIAGRQGGVGCIGCHPNSAEAADACRHGPDLAAVSTKLLAGRRNDDARRWLMRWLADPRSYDPAALMPRMRLAPAETRDLAEYLLSLPPQKDWGASPPPVRPQPSPAAARDAAVNYGCVNCHAMPELESAGNPCPDLSDFGDKSPDLLDFGALGAAPSPTSPGRIPRTREAWLEQKLRNPRIFDVGRDFRAASSRPPQKLRMPDFGLDDRQVQALATFILSNRRPMVSHRMRQAAVGRQQHAIAGAMRLAAHLNCTGCHQFDSETPPVRQYWLGGRFDPGDMVAMSPPSLAGHAPRVHPSWLAGYLKDVGRWGSGDPPRIRPPTFMRMPDFGLDDQQATAFVSYFHSAAAAESERLKRLVEAADRAGDGRLATGDGARAAESLRRWSISTGRQRAIEFAGDARRAHASAVFDARLLAALYDSPYPFTDQSIPAMSAQRLQTGRRFFEALPCLSCHELGSIRDASRCNEPRGPNLAMAHGRLQRNWMRRWLQEPRTIRPGATMPPFFSGRAQLAPDGLPWAPAAPATQPAGRDFGATATEQIDLLVDFLLAESARQQAAGALSAGAGSERR